MVNSHVAVTFIGNVFGKQSRPPIGLPAIIQPAPAETPPNPVPGHFPAAVFLRSHAVV